jgi:hypothetical protein
MRKAGPGTCIARLSEMSVQRAGLAMIILCAMSVAAAANDARFRKMLKTLDPSLRLEQVCDAEAMRQIGKKKGEDKKRYRPDRAMIGALSRPQIAGDTAEGSGGAFRSRGKWYAFSFTCETAPDRLSVTSFDFKVGRPIPEEKWPDYGLYR